MPDGCRTSTREVTSKVRQASARAASSDGSFHLRASATDTEASAEVRRKRRRFMALTGSRSRLPRIGSFRGTQHDPWTVELGQQPLPAAAWRRRGMRGALQRLAESRSPRNRLAAFLNSLRETRADDDVLLQSEVAATRGHGASDVATVDDGHRRGAAAGAARARAAVHVQCDLAGMGLRPAGRQVDVCHDDITSTGARFRSP